MQVIAVGEEVGGRGHQVAQLIDALGLRLQDQLSGKRPGRLNGWRLLYDVPRPRLAVLDDRPIARLDEVLAAVGGSGFHARGRTSQFLTVFRVQGTRPDTCRGDVNAVLFWNAHRDLSNCPNSLILHENAIARGERHPVDRLETGDRLEPRRCGNPHRQLRLDRTVGPRSRLRWAVDAGPVVERLRPCLIRGSVGELQRDLLRQLVAVGCRPGQIEIV